MVLEIASNKFVWTFKAFSSFPFPFIRLWISFVESFLGVRWTSTHRSMINVVKSLLREAANSFSWENLFFVQRMLNNYRWFVVFLCFFVDDSIAQCDSFEVNGIKRKKGFWYKKTEGGRGKSQGKKTKSKCDRIERSRWNFLCWASRRMLWLKAMLCNELARRGGGNCGSRRWFWKGFDIETSFKVEKKFEKLEKN